MSEPIHVTQSANAGAAQSKLSSPESGNNPASTDDTEGFTAVFASYVESDPATTEQRQDEDLAELLTKLLPQEMIEDGNSLPEQDNAVMWQALMLLQPAENVMTDSASKQMPSISLLDSQQKPVLNPLMLNQDYFNSLGMQKKEPGTSIPAGLMANDITAQLAAAHFIPDSKESLLLNINEQLIPLQGTSSNLSQSLAAVGFGSVTQAATTQTQMAPLNLGQNAWETNLGSRLQMLVGQNIQTAEIRLDPPELGALDIKIKITNDIASVNITSPHAHVREAIETSVPRLREMFEESGLSLGDVNVRQESFAQQQEQSGDNKLTGFVSNNAENKEEQIQITGKIISNNMLDTYA